MNSDERGVLEEILVEATRALLSERAKAFEVIGAKVALAPRDGTLAASIGLSGAPALKGKLVLIAQPEFFRSVHPLRGPAQPDLSEDALADWASEMANQLLGRIKNMVSSRALDFSLSIPTVVRGDRLELLCRDRPSVIERCVRVDGHDVDLLLEIAHEDGRPLLGESPDVSISAEGSTLLF